MALIETHQLEKIYRSDTVETPALGGVSLRIEAGEFVAVMGPSGSGKSTLLHILGLLDQGTGGEYVFDGKPVGEYSPEEISRARNRTMGFVFQSFNLLPRMSVLGNVKLPLLYSGVPEAMWEGRARAALGSVGLTHRLAHEPSELSGGEKQRAAIARALVLDPKIIFADEPTGNLDSKSGQMVMAILERLNAEDGRTIVLITHETYTAEHAGRIIRLKDGLIESDEIVRNRRANHDFLK